MYRNDIYINNDSILFVGEQFMCEWCDLVFNSEEKLDMHIDSEHQDAMAADDSINEISYLEGKLVSLFRNEICL